VLGKIKVIWQYCLPQHFLSRLLGKIANSNHPKLNQWLIRLFIKHFKVNVAEADPCDPKAYRNFNEFFARKLNSQARPLGHHPSGIIAPADGTICQIGATSTFPQLIAKGHHYSVSQLLGDSDSALSKSLAESEAMTIYLAPSDYHRVHMPISGQLIQMTYIPGRLFSVNPTTTKHVKGLFARNERVVCFFNTEIGPIAIVLIGAMLVASIKTTWAGTVTPCDSNKITTWHYGINEYSFAKGDEIGQFIYGSTVIALFPKNSIVFGENLNTHQKITMGQLIGTHIS